MSTFIRRANTWLDGWLFRTRYVSVRGLAAFRICLALYILLLQTPGHLAHDLSGYSDLPKSFYGPALGPMMFFSSLPSSNLTELGTFVLTVSLALVLIGWQTRVATAVACISLLWLLGVENSLGKLNHGSTPIAFTLAIMTFSPWGRALSVDSVLARRRGDPPPGTDEGIWVGQLVALALGVSFFEAGMQKFLGGWLSLSSHATEYYADRFLFRGDGTDISKMLLETNLGPFWEMGDYATVILETGFLLAVFRLRTLRAFCALVLAFHVVNYLVLSITFLYIEILYALFLPWDQLLELRPFRWLTQTGEAVTSLAGVAPYAMVGGAALVGVLLALFGSPLTGVLDLLLPFDDPDVVLLYAGTMVIFASYVALQGRSLLQRFRPMQERAV